MILFFEAFSEHLFIASPILSTSEFFFSESVSLSYGDTVRDSCQSIAATALVTSMFHNVGLHGF